MSDDPKVRLGAYVGPLSGAAIRGLLTDQQIDALFSVMELELDRQRYVETHNSKPKLSARERRANGVKRCRTCRRLVQSVARGVWLCDEHGVTTEPLTDATRGGRSA